MTRVKFIWNNQRSLIDSDIKLDDLAIMETEYEKYPLPWIGILNQLYERGFYKRVHVHVRLDKVHLAPLKGLVTVSSKGDWYNTLDLSPLTSVKELSFIIGTKLDVTKIPNLFTNLQRLIIGDCKSFDIILPFIRHSTNLREIILLGCNEEIFSLSAFNSERKRLNEARKVVIYVDEPIYLATKWTFVNINVDLIEIQRLKSRDPCKNNWFFDQ